MPFPCDPIDEITEGGKKESGRLMWRPLSVIIVF